MAVAHDVETRFPATDGTDTTTGNRTFSHAAAAGAKGAVVQVYCTGTTAVVTGVLYGGTAMTLWETATDTSEAGRIDIYVLTDLTGLGGTQTVTLQGCTATAKWVTCNTATAGTSLTKIAGSNHVNTTTSTNPTMNVVTTAESLLYGGVHGGAAAPTSYVSGTGYTSQENQDYGTLSAQAQRRTSPVAAGTITFNFTFATSDDWCLAAVALAEYTPKTTAPTYTYYELAAGWHGTGSPATTPTVSWVAGDYVYVFGETGQISSTTLGTPTHSGANLGTFAAYGTNPSGSGSQAGVYVWRAGPATGSGSSTISATVSGSDERGLGVLVVSGSDGAGTKRVLADSAIVVSVPREENHSLVVYAGPDWGAGTAPTAWAPSTGQTVHESSQSGNYTAVLTSWNDQGAPGSTNYGSTNGYTGPITKVGLEIFGTVTSGTPVGKDLQLVWDVRQAVGDTVQAVWNAQSAVGDTVQLVWNVSTSLGDTLQLAWDVRAAVGDPLDLRWDVRQALGDTLQLIWNVETLATAVGRDLGLIWNIQAAVGDPLQLVWDTRAALGDTLQLAWDIRQAVGDPVALVWNVGAAVGDTLDLRWDVRQAVGDTVQLVWNVEVTTLTAVGKDLGLPWDVRAAVGAAVQLMWNVEIVVAPVYYFTPPYRNRFVSFAEEEEPDTLTQPLRSMRPSVPRAVNLWLHDDGLLHEQQPRMMTPDSKWFEGGAMYGPLSQADIDLITNSGYGAYLHTVPTGSEP